MTENTKKEQAEAPVPEEIPYSEVSVSMRHNDVYEEIEPGMSVQVRWQDGAYEWRADNGVSLRIQILRPDMVRIRYTPDGRWGRDFSYAVDPDFQPQNSLVTLQENNAEYVLSGEQLQIVVTKQGLKIRIFDLDDHLLYEHADGFVATRSVMEGWRKLSVSQTAHRKERFYGMGDKAFEGASLNGRSMQNWCSDSFAYGAESDPLYRAVPFYYSLHLGKAYGIYFDNSFRTHFDFNSDEKGFTTFWSEGGEMDYYFIYGPELIEVTKKYHTLTGTLELPPLWAVGYHQCRWSYYPEVEVLELAARFRREKIPCDAIYLDIDYMDGYRCFTWNYGHFPDPKRMMEEISENGFKTVVMIDPGLKVDENYSVFQDAFKRGFLLKTAEGELAQGPVWPGWCAFPDFTRPEVRAWWGRQYAALYLKDGAAGFWNDMNEPAVFHVNHKTLPDAVRHDFDGDPTNHRKAHNIYGMQMARASWDGLKQLQPEKRPFLLARASFAGGQRFGAVWTGDNCATWEHLQIANVQCQRLSISGFSFCGTDIGGFAGKPDGELYTRWLQLSVFHPLMRTHSMGEHTSGDALDPEGHNMIKVRQDREPWTFGERWTAVARKAIELRYSLLPAIYTAFWQHSTQRLPILSHVAFADQNDPKLLENDREFMFGRHVLVSPIVQPKVQRQMVYLPAGNWYYFWTGQPASGEMFVNVLPDQIPFFVKEGAVLPIYPVRQHTGEALEELILYVYYKNGTETSELYEDAGEGYDYLQDHFSLKTYFIEGTAQQIRLTQQKTGKWIPPYQKTRIFLVGFPTFARTCQVDETEMPVKEIRLRDRSLYTMVVPATFNTILWIA